MLLFNCIVLLYVIVLVVLFFGMLLANCFGMIRVHTEPGKPGKPGKSGK